MMLNQLRGKLLVPMLLMGAIVLSEILFGAVSLLPTWQEHSSLASDVDVASTQAAERALPGTDGVDVALAQLRRFEERRNEAAVGFLTEAEADRILNLVYGYAGENRVEITDLHAVTSEADATASLSSAFQTRIYSLEVAGSVQRLLAFVGAIKEASAPAVLLRNVTIQPAGETSSLTLEMVLYTSLFANGSAFETLPEFMAPTLAAPYPTPLPTLTHTPTMTPSPTITLTPTPTPSPTVTPTETPTSTPTATPPPAGPVVGLGTYDDRDAAVKYVRGTWESIASQRGYDGSYQYSTDVTATVELNFIGTGVAVQYVAYKNFGIFEIYVDDVLVRAVDGYASDGVFGQVVHVSGLTSQVHTLSIRNTDRRNMSSAGNVIAIDVLYVLESAPTGQPG